MRLPGDQLEFDDDEILEVGGDRGDGPEDEQEALTDAGKDC